jgi:calcium permeable stress-gated cation channel
MISQGEVEMSLIKKNFFFTFFNLFLVFTVFGTAFKAIENADQKGKGFRNGFNDIFRSLKDTTRVAYILAASLQGLAAFYINLVILQGLGLFPFRLLEFGSVTLYPIYLMGAKTPRGILAHSLSKSVIAK